MKRYDPQIAPDPEVWKRLDEGQKLTLVKEFVRRNETQIEGQSEHAAIHTIVENQIAEGDETPVAEAVARLQAEGIDRHEVIHSMGFLVMQRMFNLVPDSEPFDEEEYFDAVSNWSAEQWFSISKMDDEPNRETYETPAPTVEEVAKVGRNEPCPCGSGKKFKKCCGSR
ncbi:MAG: SEC-C metal-binding domain-containing protein [Verrucomicrobiales bacterium]|nr:SEC-C metal-binding domain-containing protein [Verrucomicrobiales bacterium]